MSDKLNTTLANLNLELPKTTNKVDLSSVHDTPLIDPIATAHKPIHNQVEIEPQAISDQFTEASKIVEEKSLDNNIASKKTSMLAQNGNELPDYTNYTGKKKVEMAKPDGTRIPLSIQKRITIMLHEAKMADEPLTKQDIYCRALSRYLESEGY